MSRDSELELLLAKLRNAKPSDAQLGNWRAAVENEVAHGTKKRASRFRWSTQLAAMLALGFFLGIATAKHLSTAKENNEPIATAQYIYSKSE